MKLVWLKDRYVNPDWIVEIKDHPKEYDDDSAYATVAYSCGPMVSIIRFDDTTADEIVLDLIQGGCK